MNRFKRISELRDEAERLTELQNDEERKIREATDAYHGIFLAGRVKARARRLTEIENEIAGLYHDAFEGQAGRSETISGRTA